MKVLIVGAGAVGQTFGYHLNRGGADVHFFVKPKYESEARQGYTLYDLRQGGRDVPLSWTNFGVLTDLDAVTEGAFDVVMITVSSDALRAGDWVEALVNATPDATICGMQPGLDDQDFVEEFAGSARTVWGMIEIIAYHAPLEREQVPRPGVAFWAPSFLGFPMSGPAAIVAPLASAFQAGGFRGRHVPDVGALTAIGSAVLNLHMVGLEIAGWKLNALRADSALLATTHTAIQQATSAVAAQRNLKVPLWVRALRPWHSRVLGWLAPKLLPLDLDTYMREHFSKVGRQTGDSVSSWIDAAKAEGSAFDALETLQTRRAAVEAS